MIFVHLRIHVCYCWWLPRVFGHVLELPAEKSVFDTAYRAQKNIEIFSLFLQLNTIHQHFLGGPICLYLKIVIHRNQIF